MILQLMLKQCIFSPIYTHPRTTPSLPPFISMIPMPSSHYPPNSQTMPCFLTCILILVLFLSFLPPDVLSQTTLADCGANLLPLAPCAPFVQGAATTPLQTCCDSLTQLQSQQPSCICLLLHDTSLASSFPINTTLALQLPTLCNVTISPSVCPGTSLTTPTGVSFGEMPNSTSVADSPVVTVAPKPSSMIGIHQSAEVRLKFESQLLMLQLASIFAVLIRTH